MRGRGVDVVFARDGHLDGLDLDEVDCGVAATGADFGLMSSVWEVAAVHCSAGGAHALDDRWGVVGELAWVLDGATDLSAGVLFPGAQSNASWLAERVSRALGSGPAIGSAADRLAAAIAAADAEATALGVHDVVGFPTAVGILASPVDATADASGPGMEFTVIGDCAAVVEVHREEMVGVELITDPAWAPGAPNAAAGGPPWSTLSARDLNEKLLASRLRRNTPQGRWIIRREPEASAHAHRQTVRSTTGRVVLFSDGAERALRRPGFDAAALLSAAFEDPDGFVSDLRAWENTAPTEIPSWWTPHDDVTMLALTIA